MSPYVQRFTAKLRERVKAALGYCPTCGQPRNLNTRQAAKRTGVSHTNLWRFLSGKAPSAATIDQLVKWLDEAEAKESRAAESTPAGGEGRRG